MHYRRWQRNGHLERRPRVCTIEGCERSVVGRGWCTLHYQRWLAHGHPERLIRPHFETREQMFWAKVKKTDTCWLWTGALTNGYGVFRADERLVRAHRFAYELLVGPIPEGLQLDHVKERGCTHRRCVNPAHLEPVTQIVNNQRVERSQAVVCNRGHALTGENILVQRSGRKTCRECGRRRMREYRARLNGKS